MITLARAKTLKTREVLVDSNKRRWYVNGMVKTWKTDPSRIRVPLKHGLYTYGSLTEADFTDGECTAYTLESDLNNPSNTNTQGA